MPTPKIAPLFKSPTPPAMDRAKLPPPRQAAFDQATARVAVQGMIEDMLRRSSGEPAPPALTGAMGERFLGTFGSVNVTADGMVVMQSTDKDVARLRWGMAKRAVLGGLARDAHGKPLAGDAAALKGERWEAMDPNHRFSEFTALMWENFREFNNDAYWRPSYFLLWLAVVLENSPEEIRAFLKGKVDPELHRAVDAYIAGGVNYLPARQRSRYQLTVRGGLLYQEGRPFDTTALSTVHYGRGWAIYVVAQDGTAFSGPHRTGVFHHSSFLSGRAVRSAGEWQVKEGRPTFAVAKSGHYQPTAQQFYHGLQTLYNAGADLSQCTVQLYDARGEKQKLNARELVRAPVKLLGLKSWA